MEVEESKTKNEKRDAAILEVAHQNKTMIAHQKERKKNSNTLILPAQKKVRKIESKEISYFEIVTSCCLFASASEAPSCATCS